MTRKDPTLNVAPETVLVQARPYRRGEQHASFEVRDASDTTIIFLDTVLGVGAWLQEFAYRWVPGSSGLWTRAA